MTYPWLSVFTALRDLTLMGLKGSSKEGHLQSSVRRQVIDSFNYSID